MQAEVDSACQQTAGFPSAVPSTASTPPPAMQEQVQMRADEPCFERVLTPRVSGRAVSNPQAGKIIVTLNGGLPRPDSNQVGVGKLLTTSQQLQRARRLLDGHQASTDSCRCAEG